MTPEEKVVSLETAKKLKEAGFPQDTEHVWLTHEGKTSLEIPEWFNDIDNEWGCGHYAEDLDPKPIAAPDAQEIGELLPFKLQEHGEPVHYFFNQTQNQNGWQIEYLHYDIPFQALCFHGSSEAEARAACWLWLKENGELIKPLAEE